MKKKFSKGVPWTFLFIPLLLIYSGALAQKSVHTMVNKPSNGKSHTAGFGLYMPFGNFSTSHIAGIGLDYAWSRGRYGNNLSYKQPVGFTLTGGINYFAGKKITTAGYDFRYGSYFNLYAMPGILYNPLKKGNISLTTGPVLNIYKGTANAGLGINLFTNYYLSKNIAIGPGLIYRKRIDTNTLWAATIRAAYSF